MKTIEIRDGYIAYILTTNHHQFTKIIARVKKDNAYIGRVECIDYNCSIHDIEFYGYLSQKEIQRKTEEFQIMNECCEILFNEYLKVKSRQENE